MLPNRYVAEPWTQAALEAEALGRASPTTEEVQTKAAAFFDDFFSMRVIEQASDQSSPTPVTLILT